MATKCAARVHYTGNTGDIKLDQGREPLMHSFLIHTFRAGINNSIVANSDACFYYPNPACQRCDGHGAACIINEDDASDVGSRINLGS